jgi:hypothetical protein
MPAISMFFGIIIKMYYEEHNPPHIHAYYQGFEASFNILTGEKIIGKFPIKADRIVSDWIKIYRIELNNNWALMRESKPLFRIPGADQ